MGWVAQVARPGGAEDRERNHTMSFLDKAKDALSGALDKTDLDEKAQDAYAEHGDKVSGMVDEHAERIDQGIDQAGTFADEKTGGRFSEQIDTGADRVRDGLDGLDGKDDDFPNA